MANVIEHRKFVCTSAQGNNNKVWEYTKYDDGSTLFKWGRIGGTIQQQIKHVSDRELERLVHEKLHKRGEASYKEIKVVTDAPTGPTGPASKHLVKEAAVKQLGAGDRALMELVQRLAEANKHELHAASGGKLDIDLNTGIISTPVGVVTKNNIAEARKLLSQLQPHVAKKSFETKPFMDTLNEYLMLVPQTVGRTRGWHTYFIPDDSALQKQNTLLDQLEASADLAAARLSTAKQQKIADLPELFDARLKVVVERDIARMVEKKFMETINRSHESRNLRPVQVYEVELPRAKSAYETDGAKLSNQWLLWHGTRMFNVLSILKSGLIIPRSGGSFHITGRMFGDGLYFSDQSTKSLNYAYGYWDGGSRDKNCFMFMVDVAMGKYYVPGGGYGMRSIPAGYDSCYAKAGTGGVRNNEMIVYRTSQANLRYLVEFNEKHRS